MNGLRILDGGCGPGLYLSELAARGADTVGIDQSADMVRLARERLGSLAQIRQHDLDAPSPGQPTPASTSSCSPWSSTTPTTASAP